MTMRSKTCFDPFREARHACPGRCACYVNHECRPDCNCSGCHRGGPIPRRTFAVLAPLSQGLQEVTI